MRKLAHFLRAYRKQVFLGPIFKLVEAVFELIVPLVMARMIDVGVARGDMRYVLRMGGVLVLLGVVGIACSMTCQRFASIASQGTGTALRNALFAHIQTLSHAELDRFGTPSLITRITNDVNQLQYAVAMLIRLVIRAPFLALGALFMAMRIDARLSLIFLLVTPLIALTLYLVMSRSVPYYRQVQQKLDCVSRVTRENLSGARVVRTFARQKEEQRRFDAATWDVTQTTLLISRLSALLQPANTVLINGAVVAVLWFGGFRVQSGAMTQGQIIALVNYLAQILLALVVVANLVVTFTKASASAARVNEVLETMPSVRDMARQPVQPVPGAPRVAWEHVFFRYQGAQEDALCDIELTFFPGQTVGVIGGTGAGKSTLMQLLPRFYDVTAGSLRVDGVLVQDYPIAQLRARIGIALQQAVLFSGTVLDNLRWRDPALSEEEAMRMLQIAQADTFVSALPQGLHTHIEQGGRSLSGGQRQRLAIARALVGNPDILILDDSASALDFATDAALRRSLRAHRQGMTVLLVSQRVSTVRRADQIVAMEDGCVVGVGTHEELLQTCAVYREICLSQQSEEEAKRA
ncbi:MAG: ABC transporter ATP-binding protein [Clostridia bacterium]